MSRSLRLWCDGREVEPDEPAIPALGPGLLLGVGVFETFLVRDGVPTPFLTEHAKRLRRSVEIAGLAPAVDLVAEWEDLAAEDLPGLWRARFTLTEADRGFSRLWTLQRCEDPPLEVDLLVSRFTKDPADPLERAKTTSRLRHTLARREAEAAGAWDALIPTIDGDLAEGTVSNLFVVAANMLITPPLERGLLDGVTRAAILRGSESAGIAVSERRVDPALLVSAAEVLVSNALVGLMPVRRIVGVREDLPGKAGPWCARLQEAYAEEQRRAGNPCLLDR